MYFMCILTNSIQNVVFYDSSYKIFCQAEDMRLHMRGIFNRTNVDI